MKYIANPVEVDAAIIKEIGPIDESGGCWLTVGDMDYVADNGFFATKEMLSRIVLKVGDYLVRQADGYFYFNLKEVFERKYHAV